MTVPQLSLLAFALWTISIPLGAVGVYRWTRILTGAASIEEFRADAVHGSDWYRRAMRAHANCVENLPVFGAIVFCLTVLKMQGAWIDVLSITVLCGRAAQSTVHLAWPETRTTTSFRFAFFFLQLCCMYALGGSALVTGLEGVVRTAS